MRIPPITVLFLSLAISACATSGTRNSPASDIDSVREFVGRVATGVTSRGPIAWHDFFDESPDFFMASEGKLVFASGEAARKGIDGLTHVITSIELRWGTDMRIQSLGPGLAIVAAPYHEVLVLTEGRKIEEEGYFTGVATRTPKGWRFRNAHWSTIASGQPVP